MAKTKEIFASNFITADRDLLVNNSPTAMHLQISGYEVITMGDEPKHVLHFSNFPKSLVLNKTNFNTLMKVHPAEDTDSWNGKWITIRAAEVEYKGEMVWGTRIALQAPDGDAIVAAAQNMPTEDEDVIPF